MNTVFQDYALFPHLSVGDNVAYGLVVRNVPRPEREARVAEALRMAWLGVGSLLILFLNPLWSRDAFTGAMIYEPTLRNFGELLSDPYPGITLRTVAMAALVTVTCAVLALPVAYYMTRVASRRVRNALVVAVTVPLWASYLIKVYSWRLILAEQGILNWALAPFGLRGPGFGDVAVWLVFTYLWLPYMMLPVYAGLSRIPESLPPLGPAGLPRRADHGRHGRDHRGEGVAVMPSSSPRPVGRRKTARANASAQTQASPFGVGRWRRRAPRASACRPRGRWQ